GIFCSSRCEGMSSRAARPTPVPMAKQMAESWKGGIAPEASVSSASSDHIATAEKPIRVARAIIPPGRTGPLLFHGFKPPRPDCDPADLGAHRCANRRVYTCLAQWRKCHHDTAFGP